jgi:hypothetical protein
LLVAKTQRRDWQTLTISAIRASPSRTPFARYWKTAGQAGERGTLIHGTTLVTNA